MGIYITSPGRRSVRKRGTPLARVASNRRRGCKTPLRALGWAAEVRGAPALFLLLLVCLACAAFVESEWRPCTSPQGL